MHNELLQKTGEGLAGNFSAIFFATYSQTALLFLQHMALLGFLPTTLCCGMIRTHAELLQTGTFERRSMN